MATLWQPYDLAWKILRSEVTKRHKNKSDTLFAEPKTMFAFAVETFSYNTSTLNDFACL